MLRRDDRFDSDDSPPDSAVDAVRFDRSDAVPSSSAELMERLGGSLDGESALPADADEWVGSAVASLSPPVTIASPTPSETARPATRPASLPVTMDAPLERTLTLVLAQGKRRKNQKI